MGRGISSDDLDNLEENLLQTDMGYDTVQVIIDLVNGYSGKDLTKIVRDKLVELLPDRTDLNIDKIPCVIPIVGVNGSGKTTSAAKLANMAKVGHLIFYHLTPAPRNRIMENVFVRGVDEIRTDWTLSRDGTFVILPVGTEEINLSDLN